MLHNQNISRKYSPVVEKYHQYLLEHQKKLLKDLPWELSVIKQLKIGYDYIRECLVFPIYNELANLINIYWHKSVHYPPKLIAGAPAKLLYPLPLIKQYPKDEPLVYCEGLKDAVTWLSKGKNVITHIGSASAIPDDLSLLSCFNQIILAFDNDQPGQKASTKLSIKLLEKGER